MATKVRFFREKTKIFRTKSSLAAEQRCNQSAIRHKPCADSAQITMQFGPNYDVIQPEL